MRTGIGTRITSFLSLSISPASSSRRGGNLLPPRATSDIGFKAAHAPLFEFAHHGSHPIP
jgi:hypothetical protein